MNWKEIKISSDNKAYLFQENQLFGKVFIEALKFHSPGLAAVKDESGSYHIDVYGKELYKERYKVTFPADEELDDFDEHTKPMLAVLVAARAPLPED